MRARTKIILTVIGTLAIIITAGALFYRSIQTPVWAEQKGAVLKAYDKSLLVSATGVESFVGETPYQIVFGTDKLGQPVIVWVSETDLHTEYASSGITADQAKQKRLAIDPAAHVLRAVPGKYMGEYVWELFYTKKENGKLRHFYDYYRFTDGQPLDTLSLSVQ